MRTAKEAEALLGAAYVRLFDEYVFLQKSIAWHEALWGVPYGPVDPSTVKPFVGLEAVFKQSSL